MTGGTVLARLRLLGSVRLETAEGRDVTPRGAKARGLLAYLALSPEGTAPRAKVAALLWGESLTAMVSLRQAVKEIREAFARGDPALFFADHRTLRLDLKRVWVDALAFHDLVERPANLGDARPRCTRGLLEDETIRAAAFQDWLLVEQTRCRQLLVRVLEDRLDSASSEGEREATRECAEFLLALEPAHEGAYRALMRCHGDAGDVAGAIRCYEACRTVLARELDVRPSVETEDLLQAIRDRECATKRPVEPAAARAKVRHRPVVAVVPKAKATGVVDRSLGQLVSTTLRDGLSRHHSLSVVDTEVDLAVTTEAQRSRLGLPEVGYLVMIDIVQVAQRMRLLFGLKDVSSNQLLWQDRLDLSCRNDALFELDPCIERLAFRLEQEILRREIDKARRKPVAVSSAYELVLRAIPLIIRMTPDSFLEARRLLDLAAQADPLDPMVYSWRAFWLFLSFGQGWAEDEQALKEELGFCIGRALELDLTDAFANTVAGHVASFVFRDCDEALEYFERAMRCGGNQAYALGFSAITQNYIGRPTTALQQLKESSDLAPLDPLHFFFRTTASTTNLLTGNFERSVQLARRTVREHPTFHAAFRPLIASLGQLGRREEAQTQLAALRAAGSDLTVDWFRRTCPPLLEDHEALYVEGLRKAGVPEM